MNNFFTDNFNISKINICIYVASGTGKNIHRNRPNHGLVIQLSGIKKYVFENDGEMTVKEGEVFYLPKFSDYNVISIQDGDCIAVNFELTDNDITYPYFSVSPKLQSKYLPEFKRILKMWNAQGSGSLNCCLSILYGIIYNIQQDKQTKYLQSKTAKPAGIAAEYIAAHFSDIDLSIHQLAELLDITPEYFRALFKSTYGVSPKKYIINLRIAKAKELIACGEFHIGAISEMCGFKSESYFSREFKRITAYTPSEYMRQKLSSDYI